VATEAFLGVRPANNYLYFIIASPSAQLLRRQGPQVGAHLGRDAGK